MAARSSCGDNARCWLGKSATGRAKCAFHSGQYSLSKNALASSRVATLAKRRCFTKRSCAVRKLRSMRPLACGEYARMEPIPNSLMARPSCVSRSASRCCSLLSPRPWRDREHRIAVGVNIHHPAVLLQIFPEHSHVLWGCIALNESSPTPTRCIVDHPHQVAHRPSAFEPIVIGRVPLHQFAEPGSPRSPNMHVLDRLHLALPQSRFDHPSAQGFFSDVNLMPFGQLFRGEGRPEIVPIRFLQDR